MKKLNKKGFSLVELVTATAILGMVGLTIIMLMTSGTNMYSGIQKRSNVLFKSQIASAQVKGLLSDACREDGIGINGKTIYIFDKSANEETIITYSDDNSLRITQKDIKNKQIADKNPKVENKPFCYNVANISFPDLSDMYETDEKGIKRFYAIKVDIETTRNGLHYTKNELISFRSKPVYAEGADAETYLLAALYGGENG